MLKQSTCVFTFFGFITPLLTSSSLNLLSTHKSAHTLITKTT